MGHYKTRCRQADPAVFLTHLEAGAPAHTGFSQDRKENERALWGTCYRNTNPAHEGMVPISKALPPNAATLGTGVTAQVLKGPQTLSLLQPGSNCFRLGRCRVWVQKLCFWMKAAWMIHKWMTDCVPTACTYKMKQSSRLDLSVCPTV